MFSYIYMKILESSPERYDYGIRWLSLGHIEVVKKRIVLDWVKPNSRVLEIGIGTATLALLIAEQGANVVGFDISAGMLAVAEKKIAAAAMLGSVDLLEMGIAGMDRFSAHEFDMVVATLVFSELSKDEQRYALGQAFRVLKPGGGLIIADEVQPKSILNRFVQTVFRIPLLLVTFLLTQTTTRTVQGLEESVADTGFKINQIEHSRLDRFVCLFAEKSMEDSKKE